MSCSLYKDKYRNWFTRHWVRNDAWHSCNENDASNTPNHNRKRSEITTDRYRRMQQFIPPPYGKDTSNNQGMHFVLKNLEQESLTNQDSSRYYKKLSDELSEKMTFLQNTLLTQQNKINQKNQTIHEMSVALEKYSGKYNHLSRKQPILEQKLREFEEEKHTWQREKSLMAVEINGMASKKQYRQERKEEENDYEQKEAMVSLLEGNSRLLDRNYNVCKKAWFQHNSEDGPTEQRLKQLKEEKDRIKMVLNAKKMELNKLRKTH